MNGIIKSGKQAIDISIVSQESNIHANTDPRTTPKAKIGFK